MVKDRIIILGALCATTTALAVIPSYGDATSALTPTPRYASPTGVSTGDCPHSAPCELTYALDGAANGGEVILESGNYGSNSDRITALVKDGGAHLRIPRICGFME